MWEKYRLELHVTNRLCGSVPQSKELIRPWLEARKPTTAPAGVAEGTLPTLDALEAEVAETLPDETEERITLGFQRDAQGLFVRGGTLKAHIKDCALQVAELTQVKNFRSKVTNGVFIEPDRLCLLRDGTGEVIQAEDGEFERAVHVMTRLGPRNALKRIRYVDQPLVVATLRLLADGKVTEKHLRMIFDYGCYHGYGGERGLGEGRYTYSLERLDKGLSTPDPTL